MSAKKFVARTHRFHQSLKRPFVFYFGIFSVVSILLVNQGGAQQAPSVQSLGFDYKPGKSKLEFSFDSDVQVEKTLSSEDNQVILEIKNAKIGKKWARRIDTSQQKSNVSMISPYQSGENVRIVLQMKDKSDVELVQNGSKITAVIDNKDGLSAESNAAADATTAAATAENAESAADTSTENTSTSENVSTPPAPTQISDSGNANEDSLEGFFKAHQTKKYTGKRIYLQVRDTEVADVFRIISEASEFNIILSDQVKGRVMLNLIDVPWDQALDLILQSQHLAAERQGNVLRITSLDAYTKEKAAEANALLASQAAEPLVVKIFPISYAKIDDLKKIILDFMSRENISQNTQVVASANSGVIRGSLQVDTRTNSLIVRDTPTTIEKIKKIVKELDTQTPQILIEAKFVEVSEVNTHNIQGRVFGTTRELDSTGSFAFRPSNNNVGGMFGSGFGNTLATAFSLTPANGGAAFGFAPKAGIIPGLGDIGAFLSVIESESKAKVIASPRVVAQNKEKAEINQGQSIQIPVPGGANVAGGFQTIDAILKLEVTPQVTNDGTITLKLTFKQDAVAPAPPGASFATNTKKVETQVTVDSGSTLVIGGIYTSNFTEGESGIPILRNLPLIGALFGAKSKTEDKGELFIFVTPRVINEKESGLRG